MRPHELDAVSLIAGLVFLAVGLGHLLGIDVADLPFRGLWPLLLIVGGGILLIRAARRPRDDG